MNPVRTGIQKVWTNAFCFGGGQWVGAWVGWMRCRKKSQCAEWETVKAACVDKGVGAGYVGCLVCDVERGKRQTIRGWCA